MRGRHDTYGSYGAGSLFCAWAINISLLRSEPMPFLHSETFSALAPEERDVYSPPYKKLALAPEERDVRGRHDTYRSYGAGSLFCAWAINISLLRSEPMPFLHSETFSALAPLGARCL